MTSTHRASPAGRRWKPMPPRASSPPSPEDWKPEPGPTFTVEKEPATPRIRVGREVFFLEVEDGTYYLRHPAWSLMGSGDSPLAAEKDLRVEAEELAEVMADMPLGSLDYQALKLYRFVLSIS